MSRPFRSQQIPNMQEAIKDAAWKEIAESGAAALSLRAIARKLGITAPAIYNYFPNRDELVTALILDAYNSLADSQEASVADLPGDALAGRLSDLGLAYRQWAVDAPQRYELIFGTPIPHYHAPEEVTLPAAARALLPLIGAIQAVHSAGRLRMKKMAEATPKLASMLSAWSEASAGAPPEVLYLALVIWSRVHGLVMLEITNNLPAFIDEPGEIFQREVDNLIIQYVKSSKGE